MQDSRAATAAVGSTRDRILDVALEVLGSRPTAGMGEVAAAAGVVRRTIYGHFPSRVELVQTIAQRAADELRTALLQVTSASTRADTAWVEYVARLWPLAHRYRILVVLRRSEHSDAIHMQLEPVEQLLTDLVCQGQEEGIFAPHLPAATLAQLGQSIVFTLADERAPYAPDINAAAITSLLTLGVPEADARALARAHLGTGTQPPQPLRQRASQPSQ